MYILRISFPLDINKGFVVHVPYVITKQLIDWLIDIIVFNATFSNISAISWRPDLVVEETGVHREPPTMGNQLVNFITSGCESSAPFLYFAKRGTNPRRIGDRLE